MPDPWVGQLQSTYRGLSTDAPGIELRPLTLIMGPNNGGKSQYLRSFILLDAVRQVFGGGVWDFYGGPAVVSARGSIAQALIDAGFRDLAEELAELMRDGKKLELRWEVGIPDYVSLAEVAKEGYDIYRRTRRSSDAKARTKGSRRATFHVFLSLEQSHEIVVEKMVIANLWEQGELTIVRRPEPSAASIVISSSMLWLASHRLRWKTAQGEFDGESFANHLIGSLPNEERNELGPEWMRALVLGYVLHKALSQLPEISYVGPIRILDDRDPR
jgi:hypothetical protein